MHPDIRQFPSEQFYDGNLVDSSSVQCMALASTSVLNYGESILLTRMEIPRFRIVKNGSTGKFKECSHQIPVNVPTRKDIAFFSLVERTLFVRTIEFFDISNSIEEKDQTNSKTLVNIMEAQFIVAMIAAMTTAIGDHKIGIITPYDGQKRLLRDLISEAGDLRRFMGGNTISAQRNQIEVNTVDGFQGREKDLIIISCVRTSKSSIGFLDDDRRMNVAITRAKKCLIVVGNADALRCSTSWNKFVTHCRDYNCLTTLMLTKK